MLLRRSMLKASLAVLQVHLLASVVTSHTYTTELSLKYFTDVSMLCDHPDLNLTARSDIRSMTWIFPNGETVDAIRRPDPKLFVLTGPSPELQAYNLTALSINDPVFGYYICVAVGTSTESPISVIKWGLNVQGADFSDLIETYQENAIVGGIAAASIFVAIVAVCLLWHFRYSNRHHTLMTHWEEKSADDDDCLQAVSGQHNESYIVSQDEDTEMTVKAEANGSNVKIKTELS